MSNGSERHAYAQRGGSAQVTVVRRGAQQLVSAFNDFQRTLHACPQAPGSTLKREGIPSGYCLVLRGCRVRVPQALSVPGAVPRGGGVALRFRVSLFDYSSGSYFGRTYTSARSLALTDRGSGLVETEDAEVLYMISSIKDNNAATIVEAVLVVHDAAGVALQVGSLLRARRARFHLVPDLNRSLCPSGVRSWMVPAKPPGPGAGSYRCQRGGCRWRASAAAAPQ